MIMFTYASIKSGFSKPLRIMRRELKELPRYGELDDLIGGFYDRIDYILSYVRLEDGGPVLMIEVPVDNSVVSEDSYEDLITWFFNQLSSISYRGYPYPLIEVDKLVKITRQDMVNLAQIIGFLPRMTGREVLVEWL